MKEKRKSDHSVRDKLRLDMSAPGHLRVLCFAAMLAAMSVVLATLAKLVFGTGPLRVTFENFPIVFGGISFGPLIGAMIAAVADLLSCLISGQAPNPLILVGSVTIGVVSGIFGRYVLPSRNWLSLWAVDALAEIVGSVVLKSWALHAYFGYDWLLLLPRVPVYLVIIVGESYLLFTVFKSKPLLALLERIYQK